MHRHWVARGAARAAAGGAVTVAAIAFTFAAGGGAVASHVPLYGNSAPYALTAAGHDDDAHVDFSYEFLYLPRAESSGTAVATGHAGQPEV